MQQSNNDHEDLLKSISFSKLVLPIILGLGAVVYLMQKQLNLEEIKNINWAQSTLWWLLVAIGLYVMRHIFYALRLKALAGGQFTFWKSMELIIIWEFSSAVSPTSVGGAGVALVLLAQEKLSGAKTVSVVLYSMVADTLFFIFSLPLLYLFLGPLIIRPGMNSISHIDGYGITFITVLVFMAAYGGLFFYGLFINPRSTKRFLLVLSKIPFLKRFRADLRRTATDVVVTSKELTDRPLSFHLEVLGHTLGAWIVRFLALNCIILALIPETPFTMLDQALIFARGEAMHTITAFSPTPGGAGIAEYLFGGFFSDYISKGVASLIALIWRLITYYPYLILGAIFIPIWIREIIAKRKKAKEEEF